MANIEWEIDDVQSLWNKIEETVINITDDIVPIREYVDNVSTLSQETPTVVKRKMRQRKLMLAKMRQNPDEELKKRINWLNLSMTAFKLQAKRIFLTQ